MTNGRWEMNIPMENGCNLKIIHGNKIPEVLRHSITSAMIYYISNKSEHEILFLKKGIEPINNKKYMMISRQSLCNLFFSLFKEPTCVHFTLNLDFYYIGLWNVLIESLVWLLNINKEYIGFTLILFTFFASIN